MKPLDVSLWLGDPDLARLFTMLEQLGGARFVGGAVRDALLGLEHSDLDLATPALPETVMGAAQAAGFRMVPTGLDHGTVTAVLARGPVEITTLRRDVETDGRHATVAFTDDWQADAARRDFTINALSADTDGKVYDYFGGVDDLNSGVVRFIGDAANRIREDYLRILRFFRFSGRFTTGALDDAALTAIRQLAPEMTRLSGERLRIESLKLLIAPKAVEMWQAMIDAGVVDAFLPAAREVARLKVLVALDGEYPDSLLRLMAVLPDLTKAQALAISDRLKLSARDRERLAMPARSDRRLADLEEGKFGAALYGLDTRLVMDLAMIETAAGLLPPQQLEGLIDFTAEWRQPVFPLGGENLIQLGLKPGPIFGSLLREVEQWWIQQDFTPTRQECFAELKRIWQQRKQTA